MGLVTVAILFAFIYYGGIPGSGSGDPVTQTTNVPAGGNTAPISDSHLENPHQIKITRNEVLPPEPIDNRPDPINSRQDPVQEVNNAWQFKHPTNVDASTSKAASNPWGGPPSPTGSNDSSQTITNFNYKNIFKNNKNN